MTKPKATIPLAARRALALSSGCLPGETIKARCVYCGAEGTITWFRLSNGEPSGWVHFSGLEIDHLIPEARGGATSAGNLQLACQRCNRSKGQRDAPRRCS